MSESALFRHGVASGDPLTDRVVIWTRCEEEAEPTWVVARDQALRDVVATGHAAAHTENDLTVKVDVSGLEPDRTYYYFFEVDGRTSVVGRTRTLPERCDQMRFAIYSCAKYSAGFFNAHARMAERDDIAFVLCLGDYIYEYGNEEKGLGAKIGRAFEPGNECRTLEDYRTRYSQYRRDPKLQRLHQSHPFINIVDDHEFCNDTWRDGAGKHDDEQDGPWAERKAAAFRAWREWIPIRLPDPEDPTRIFRTFRLGGLADLILLDSRTRRDEQTKDPEVLEHADRTLLGKEQFDWFVGECRRSRATWRIIGNAVMIGQVRSDFMPEDLGNPLSELGVLTQREHGPEPDQWDGYPVERRRLLECIKQNAKANILFLSGDCHSSWAMDLKLDPHDPEDESIGGEFCTTSLTSENLDDDAGWHPRSKSVEIEKEIIIKNPHIHWAETDSHGYVVVDVEPQRVQGDWWFVDEIHCSHEGEHHGESWVVRADEDRVRKGAGPVS
ncbi:alkaline phosphatase D family protein [soil metagenome]